MIEQTFLHLPGVGASLERRLWRRGYFSWDSLSAQLERVDAVRDLFGDTRQLELFPSSPVRKERSRVVDWLICLDQSRIALSDGDYAFFLDRLRPGEHWRLLRTVSTDVLYLDIETTGLSKSLHYVTVIGAQFNGRFHQWRWPEPLDELASLLSEAALVVTFNGKRFDLPFLRSHASTLPIPRAHVDLLYVARAAGCKGGQKKIEASFGLRRDSVLSEIDGEAAVALWCDGLYGNVQAYERLLQYNRADVEMMPRIAAMLCDKMVQNIDESRQNVKEITIGSEKVPRAPIRVLSRGDSAATYQLLQDEWQRRKPRYSQLEKSLTERLGRTPLVVGIDLRTKKENPTGWALCDGTTTTTQIVYDDDTILDITLAARPDLVSIDAPLALPRGRKSVFDESPCRASGGIVRDAERILWARGIRVYPALIRQMQGLTHRGMAITAKLRAAGIEVIESYPGAAQDILGIPRKGLDEGLLRRGLDQFGFHLHGKLSHDELDAVTSALVGFFYLADRYEAIGADDECDMIIPRWYPMLWTGRPLRRGVSFLGFARDSESQLSDAICRRLGWKPLSIGEELHSQLSDEPSVHGIVVRDVRYEEHRLPKWTGQFEQWRWIVASTAELRPDIDDDSVVIIQEHESIPVLADRVIRALLATRLPTKMSQHKVQC